MANTLGQCAGGAEGGTAGSQRSPPKKEKSFWTKARYTEAFHSLRFETAQGRRKFPVYQHSTTECSVLFSFKLSDGTLDF